MSTCAPVCWIQSHWLYAQPPAAPNPTPYVICGTNEIWGIIGSDGIDPG